MQLSVAYSNPGPSAPETFLALWEILPPIGGMDSGLERTNYRVLYRWQKQRRFNHRNTRTFFERCSNIWIRDIHDVSKAGIVSIFRIKFYFLISTNMNQSHIWQYRKAETTAVLVQWLKLVKFRAFLKPFPSDSRTRTKFMVQGHCQAPDGYPAVQRISSFCRIWRFIATLFSSPSLDLVQRQWNSVYICIYVLFKSNLILYFHLGLPFTSSPFSLI
jgi:hypothetical protein